LPARDHFARPGHAHGPEGLTNLMAKAETELRPPRHDLHVRGLDRRGGIAITAGIAAYVAFRGG